MPAKTALFYIGVSLLASPLLSLAQVPGEDPLILQKRQIIQMLPMGNAPGSTAPTFNKDLPDYMQAKASRYTARAYAAETGNVQTDRDVINTATDDGFKTTCTQSIASTVVPKGTTFRGGTDQVVVLRGDLVNICN